MGIRFDKDSRRATNGPLIFFSILRDPAFEEEINGAFYSGLSFYAYRFPHDKMISFGSSEGFVEGLGTPGFVIGMFDPSLPLVTIPYKGHHKEEVSGSLYTMPQESTSREDYDAEVTGIIRDLRDMEHGKVVASRVVVKEASVDLAERFLDFCDSYPENFIFCFSTPATGCWIGASPELLLEGREGRIESMALAGTRVAGTPGEWDAKNREEQSIVTDYIARVFQRNGLTPERGETFTKVSGSIEHICTPVTGVLSSDRDFELSGLLRDLSPTPALCGNPKEFALEEIRKYEKFDRGCYGGFCGPFRSAEDFRFNVVLRCASVSERRYALYVGGGITSASDPASEWTETNLKLPTNFV